jgi:hypothetical protein
MPEALIPCLIIQTGVRSGDSTRKSSELGKVLEETRARASAIEREFKDYKEEHRLSSDLGTLQAAVVGLQAQISEQGAAQKK